MASLHQSQYEFNAGYHTKAIQPGHYLSNLLILILEFLSSLVDKATQKLFLSIRLSFHSNDRLARSLYW